jgi:signal transduction histidine kinase
MTAGPPPLAELAHELRTPLAAIVGLADAMTAEVLGPLPAPYAEYARLIHRTGLHTLAVVAALNDAGPAQGEPWEAAGEVVREVSEAVAPSLEHKALALDLDLVGHAAGAMVPGRVLRQVLFNLLSNAAKFTGRGGRIAVRLCADRGGLRLEVADSGPGPAPPVQDLPPPGAGLGLPIVRTLCAAHGGAFELETTPAGATARAWLAAAQ